MNKEANHRVARLRCHGGMVIAMQYATYGHSCGVRPNNALNAMKMRCEGHQNCNYQVSTHDLGDPAKGCAKDFRVKEQFCIFFSLSLTHSYLNYVVAIQWSFQCKNRVESSQRGMNTREVDGVGAHTRESHWYVL